MAARQGFERGRGDRLSDVQRAERHLGIYGTTAPTIRGAGLVGQGVTESVPWWGWLMIGGAVGAGVIYLVKR